MYELKGIYLNIDIHRNGHLSFPNRRKDITYRNLMSHKISIRTILRTLEKIVYVPNKMSKIFEMKNFNFCKSKPNK